MPAIPVVGWACCVSGVDPNHPPVSPQCQSAVPWPRATAGSRPKVHFMYPLGRRVQVLMGQQGIPATLWAMGPRGSLFVITREDYSFTLEMGMWIGVPGKSIRTKGIPDRSTPNRKQWTRFPDPHRQVTSIQPMLVKRGVELQF